VWAVLARRLPTQYVVVATVILTFLVFNCLYGLIVNRRQLATPAATRQLTTPRALTPGQQGRAGRRGNEREPLLIATTTEQPLQQRPQSLQQHRKQQAPAPHAEPRSPLLP